MKNSTKVRLHLSKQLFESLTKQVLAEAKKGDMSGGAYTEAVKAPKGEKKPEGKMKAEVLNVSKNAVPNKVYNIGDLKRKLMDLSRQVTLMKGLDSAEIGLIIKLLDDVMKKVPAKSIAAPLKTATRAFDASTSGLDEDVEEMETMTAEDVHPTHYVDNPTLQILTQLFGGLIGSGIVGMIIKGIRDDIKAGMSKKKAAIKLAQELEAAAMKAKEEEKPQ